MLACLKDPIVPVAYRSHFREYFFWIEKPTELNFGMAQSFAFCPFCGLALPASLREQLFDELEELHDGEVDDYFNALELAPDRYKSDEWWRGRYDAHGDRTTAA